jgi:5'-3' exonuclease
MAKLIKEFPEENVLIVDAMNLAFRWKPYKANERVGKFADDFVSTIESLARSYDAGRIIVAADMKGSSYRREIYPDYKGNRKILTETQSEEEKIQIEEFFKEYERTLEVVSKRHLVLRYEGVEADDIAAYLVSRRQEYGFDSIWLISSDRDWDLLVQPGVSRFSTVTRKEITLDTWPHEVPPEQYLDFKCLMGDKGDHIPGVPKVGPKTAAKLLEEYGSVFDIADAIPLPGKYVYIKNLNEFGRDNLLRNVELMDLETFCEEAIGADNVRDIGMQVMLDERRTGFTGAASPKQK